jgi:hypothetical protein
MSATFWSGLRAGYFPEAKQRAEFRLAEAALFDEDEIVDQHALFLDDAAGGRHRARRGAADIGVMPARGDVEEDGVGLIVADAPSPYPLPQGEGGFIICPLPHAAIRRGRPRRGEGRAIT